MGPLSRDIFINCTFHLTRQKEKHSKNLLCVKQISERFVIGLQYYAFFRLLRLVSLCFVHELLSFFYFKFALLIHKTKMSSINFYDFLCRAMEFFFKTNETWFLFYVIWRGSGVDEVGKKDIRRRFWIGARKVKLRFQFRNNINFQLTLKSFSFVNFL